MARGGRTDEGAPVRRESARARGFRFGALAALGVLAVAAELGRVHEASAGDVFSYRDPRGVQYFTNGLDTKTQGVDITANWLVTAGRSGQFAITAGINYTSNKITRVAPLPPVLENSDEPGILDVVTTVAIEEERPNWRGTLAVNYSVSRFGALARMSYFGGFASAQPGFCDECREEYPSKTLFDAEVSYRFAPQVGFAIGARNIFDVYPGLASEQNSFLIYPWAAASPFGYNGRYVYVRTELLVGR